MGSDGARRRGFQYSRVGRHPGRVRPRRRRAARRDVRRPPLPRRPERGAAPDAPAGLPGPQRRASSWACARCSSGCASAGVRSSSSATSAASTTTSPSSSSEIVDQERAGHRAPRRRRAATRGDQRRQEIVDELAEQQRQRARRAAARPRRQGAGAPGLRLHGRRRPPAVRGADGRAAPAAACRATSTRCPRACRDVSPEQMQRMKDMLAELNQMLEQRERGEEPDFDGFMERYGDFFPGNPQTLDELLEQMAQSMAQMQQLLNSMTPEQRAQLQGLAAVAARGHGPALAGRRARRATCSRRSRTCRGTGSMNFSRRRPAAVRRRCRACSTRSATSTTSSTCCAQATQPGELAEVDLDQARDLLGDDAARSLERLRELAKMLEEAGLIEQREGRLELTPEGHPGHRPEGARRPVPQADEGPRRAPRGRARRASATSARTSTSPTSSATRSTSTSRRR